MAYWRGQPSVLIDPPGKTATAKTDATTSSTEITGDTVKKDISALLLATPTTEG